MSSRTVGKRCDLKPVLEAASHTHAQVVRADINAHEDLDPSLRFSTFFHNHPRDGIRLSSGSPTLYLLSRRPCECRLKRPRILHGVGKEGGGPIYSAGCRTNAPQVIDRPPAETPSNPSLAGNVGLGEMQARYKVMRRPRLCWDPCQQSRTVRPTGPP